MKKTYITCSIHPQLRFKDEDEMVKHVRDEHAEDVEEYLDQMRSEAEESIAWNLSKRIKVDTDEEEPEEDKPIDFGRAFVRIKMGKQKTLEGE
jgi:hypothetical protein